VCAVYWAALGATAAIRAFGWIQLLRLSLRRTRANGEGGAVAAVKGFRDHLRSTTQQLLSELQQSQGATSTTDADTARAQSIHSAAIEGYRAQRLDAFAIGGLALAAWGTLVTSDKGPVVPTYTTQLLFVGALSAIAGPVLFRLGGTIGTYLGLETTTGLGYAAIAIAVGSGLADALSADGLHIAGVALAVAIAVRELSEIRFENRWLKGLFGHSTGAGTTPDTGERAP
jgi:hypothetical protein